MLRTHLVGVCVLVSLAAHAQPTPDTGPPPPNTLTPAERQAGWRLLFDGKTLGGWRVFLQPGPPRRGWVVADGCLHLLPRSRAGDLVSEAEFDDFELEWEWRLLPRGNNGLKYLVTETRPGAPGHEYQMIDDAAAPAAKHQTASFYDVLAPQVPGRARPPGQWNQSRLVVQGRKVEHWLNGERVPTYELGSPEVRAAVANSKFRGVPAFGEKIRGRILLTDHGDAVWYRNLKIRELPASAVPPARAGAARPPTP